MDLAKEMRQYRYEIKRSLNLKQGDTVQSVVTRAPTADVFDSEDFKLQVDTWLSSADQERAFKSKASRAKNALLHTLGSKSIAQVAREIEDIGETPNKDDMFIVSHTKKDGNPVNAAAGETIVNGKYVILVLCSSSHPWMFCAGEDERNYRESVAGRTSVFTGVNLLVA
ncbi:uncharacterized protein LOC133873961 isoform X2 [Alnus glutinosa]|uniref:uncharacterized protein LOC133873961 isoform X2 n=1 Tax=Alnus glutinosa TaxID=3517 RepID=UPI002D79DDAC|nr:uncharacterized protein LOC133873961 isoform X2 [Alnus glutinosa]